MNSKQKCKNCDHLLIGTNYKFCPYCGQNVNVKRLNFETLTEEFLNVFHFETNHLFYTVKSMILTPGATLLDYLQGGRKKYQSPISYLFFSIFYYTLFVHWVAEPHKWYLGVVINLDTYKIILIMFGISIIGWLVAVAPKYNLFEVFIVFAYTYGTSFFIAPILICLQAPFIKNILNFPIVYQLLMSDLPSSILIIYILFSFHRITEIVWYRFVLTAIIAYSYYVYFVFKFA